MPPGLPSASDGGDLLGWEGQEVSSHFLDPLEPVSLHHPGGYCIEAFRIYIVRSDACKLAGPGVGTPEQPNQKA